MQKILFYILILVLLGNIGCKSTTPVLVQAKNYEVVSEENIPLSVKNRTGKHFQIVSEASTFEEMAQTSMLAAYELSKHHKVDFSMVLLVPNKELINTGTYYTMAEYADDNKGARGLSGIDERLFTNGSWFVRSTDETLDEKELILTTLWFKYQNDFPSKEVASSLLYDAKSLKEHVAKELKISPEEVIIPQIILKDYKTDLVEDWMYPSP